MQQKEIRKVKKMISTRFTQILRSEPNVHDMDGACPWNLVLEKVTKKFPNFDPNTTTVEWLKKLKIGSSRVRFKKFVGTTMTTIHLCPIRAVQGYCSRPIMNPEFCKICYRKSTRMVIKVRSSNSIKCCRTVRLQGHKQTRTQTSMLLISRASAREKSDTRSKKLAATTRSLRSI